MFKSGRLYSPPPSISLGYWEAVRMAKAKEYNPFDVAREQIDRAGKRLNLDGGMLEVLKNPRRELTVHFSVKMDDGHIRVFTGYRVQYKDAIRPFKGGIRDEATSRGLMYATREAASKVKLSLKGATVAVQGFGNVGMHYARLMHDEQGARIVAVSDSKGGIHSDKAFDPKEVLAFKERTGSVVGFPGTKEVTNEALLELDVAILAPCALEGVLTSENAPRVKAKIIAEGANEPTTPDADDLFHKRGILLIPDILANGGGVTVSYFEWVQNLSEFFWTKSDVDQKLEGIMVSAFGRVWDMRESKKVDMRQAAYMVAINRVVEAYKWRGIFP